MSDDFGESTYPSPPPAPVHRISGGDDCCDDCGNDDNNDRDEDAATAADQLGARNTDSGASARIVVDPGVATACLSSFQALSRAFFSKLRRLCSCRSRHSDSCILLLLFLSPLFICR